MFVNDGWRNMMHIVSNTTQRSLTEPVIWLLGVREWVTIADANKSSTGATETSQKKESWSNESISIRAKYYPRPTDDPLDSNISCSCRRFQSGIALGFEKSPRLYVEKARPVFLPSAYRFRDSGSAPKLFLARVALPHLLFTRKDGCGV